MKYVLIIALCLFVLTFLVSTIIQIVKQRKAKLTKDKAEKFNNDKGESA